MTTRDVRPPDLEMRVRTVGEHGRTRLTYTLHSPTGAVSFSHQEIAGPVLHGSPQEYQAHLLLKIEQLGQRLDVDGSALLREEIDRKLTSLGRDLWRELFPAEIRSAYREIRQSVRSWMIVSDEPWIPWELIRPYDDSHPEEILDDDFLVFQFELTRWLAGGKTPAREIVVHSFAALRTATDLPQSQQELSLLAELAGASPGIIDASPAVDSASDLLHYLETSDAEMIHFIGHGTHAAARADESGVPLPDGSVLRPVDLEGPVATRIGRTRPLVFLNACWAGQQGWSLTRLGGWAPRWVGVCGCGAFVAPLWPARDQAALLFAWAFYDALAQGHTLGQAALEARRHVRKERPGDPSSLAYTIYGHPNARLRLGGDVSTTEELAEQAAPRTGLSPLPLLKPARRFPTSLRPRKEFLAAASVVLLLLPVFRMGMTKRLVDFWIGAELPNSISLPSREKPSTPKPPDMSAENQVKTDQKRAEQKQLVPSGDRTRSASRLVVSENTFETSSGSAFPKFFLERALQSAAAQLADQGISGWTIHLDADPPRITPHVQFGETFEKCQLMAHCRARRQGISIDLGPVRVSNSQPGGEAACEEAAKSLAKEVIFQLVSSLRKGST